MGAAEAVEAAVFPAGVSGAFEQAASSASAAIDRKRFMGKRRVGA
jgi:hypothetical protein